MLVTQVADHHSFEEKSRILKFPDSTAQGVSDNYQNIINSMFRIRDRTYFNAYLDWCMQLVFTNPESICHLFPTDGDNLCILIHV